MISTVLVLFGVNTVFAQDELSGNEKIWMTQLGDTTKNWGGQTFHLG